MIPFILATIGGYLIGNSMKDETPQFNNGGYSDKVGSMKGGVKHYSVDIDLESGDEIRDLEFKSLEKAKEYYLMYLKSMMYDGEKIDDIQLVKVFKNGDYENINA
jgi:hypothetical protein